MLFFQVLFNKTAFVDFKTRKVHHGKKIGCQIVFKKGPGAFHIAPNLLEKFVTGILTYRITSQSIRRLKQVYNHRLQLAILHLQQSMNHQFRTMLDFGINLLSHALYHILNYR